VERRDDQRRAVSEFAARTVTRVEQATPQTTQPPSSGSASGPSTTAPGTETAADLQTRCEAMAERERRVMELLGAKSPERIEHDLRNVINELTLLRKLFERQGD